MRFLRDATDTADRIAAMVADIEFARYELGMAIAMAHDLGMTWEQLGEALGQSKSGARMLAQRVTRGRFVDLDEVEGEYDRIAAMIGVGDKAPRYEVRVIVSGKPGVSAVVRDTLSRHLRLEVAEERCRERKGAELWEVAPDGRARRLHVRSRAAVLRRLDPAELDFDDPDPF